VVGAGQQRQKSKKKGKSLDPFAQAQYWGSNKQHHLKQQTPTARLDYKGLRSAL
jgi:hypothetical protein